MSVINILLLTAGVALIIAITILVLTNKEIKKHGKRK